MWWALDNTTILGTQLLSPTPIIDTKSTHCIALDHLQPHKTCNYSDFSVLKTRHPSRKPMPRLNCVRTLDGRNYCSQP